LQEASGFLDNSLAVKLDSSVLFNRAVIKINGGILEPAEEDLWQALELQRHNGEAPHVSSKIRSKIGELFLIKRNWEAARRELSYALEIDPANHHAQYLLKELEKFYLKE
jgi:tetratricopeptide (TPR) repeat protein